MNVWIVSLVEFLLLLLFFCGLELSRFLFSFNPKKNFGHTRNAYDHLGGVVDSGLDALKVILGQDEKAATDHGGGLGDAVDHGQGPDG